MISMLPGVFSTTTTTTTITTTTTTTTTTTATTSTTSTKRNAGDATEALQVYSRKRTRVELWVYNGGKGNTTTAPHALGERNSVRHIVSWIVQRYQFDIM